MEKLKFAVQVFTAVLALPLLSMMELNHTKKTLPAANTGIAQRLTQNAGKYYFENTGRIGTGYQEKHFNRRYCK